MAFKVNFINRRKQGRAGSIFSRCHFSACAGMTMVSFVKDALTKLPLGLLLIVSLTLVSCTPQNGDMCVEADDWGQTINKTVVVDAKNQFTPTGINFTQGKPLDMVISGMVDLCPTTEKLCADRNDPNCKTIITPAIHTWQDSGITLQKDDKNFNINVLDSYIAINRAEQFEGRGLYAYILPNGSSMDNTKNGRMWWPHKDDASCGVKRVDGKCPLFFELWDPVTNVPGYSGIVPESGKLYFRYARSPNSRTFSESGNNPHSPWHGNYRWSGRCDACRQATILSSCTPFLLGGPLYGICIAAWQSACHTSGYLEYGIAEQKDKDRKCQEYRNGPGGAYPLAKDFPGYWGDTADALTTLPDSVAVDKNDVVDHWVSENASGSTYTTGKGYTLTVAKGCQGRFGKYLQMDLLRNVSYTQTDAVPRNCSNLPFCKSCPDGYTESVPGKCLNDLDQTILKENTPNISHQSCKLGTKDTQGEWCDLNSSRQDANGDIIPMPAAFTGPGRYHGNTTSPPTSGELWFEIIDSYSEKNAAHPDGEYYADNIGSYVVEIKTEKSQPYTDVLNLVIRPLKKIIYGYCQAGPNPPAQNPESLTEPQCRADASLNWHSGLTQVMYNKLVGSPLFTGAVRAALVLLVVVYGMLFMLGMIQEPMPHFIKRIVRAAVVIQLISPGSWAFFNQYLFTFFIDGMNWLIALLSNDFMGVAPELSGVSSTIDNPFAFADNTLVKFSNPQTWQKIFGLLSISPIGFLYIILILCGMFVFILALLKAAVVYVLSMLVIAILLILAPIFIAFLLFDSTKAYFNKWVLTLINYLFQPVLIFTALAIFNVFLFSSLYSLLHYRVCWETILSVKFAFSSFKFDIPIFNFLVPHSRNLSFGTALNGTSGVPVGFFMIMIFIIMSNIMWKMIDFMSELVAHLTVANKDSTIATKAGSMVMGGLDKVFSAVWNSRANMASMQESVKSFRQRPMLTTAKAVGSKLGMKQDK